MKVEIRQKDHTLIAGLAGDWELEHPTPRFDRLVDDQPHGLPVRAVEFDTTGLGAWDSSLLTFLLQARAYCDLHELEFKEETLPKEIVGLLELARAVPEQDVDREEGTASLVTLIGKRGLLAYEAFLASVTFT
ncbi:MAG: hypothetical protein MUO50_20130, partial [Longimicrobiales bacterium]|nr:hypothetical protein [Longimicrobiales bacterium]